MIFNPAERVAALTAAWSGERLEDGRPKVAVVALGACR